jgi:hypothetical protein
VEASSEKQRDGLDAAVAKGLGKKKDYLLDQLVLKKKSDKDYMPPELDYDKKTKKKVELLFLSLQA